VNEFKEASNKAIHRENDKSDEWKDIENDLLSLADEYDTENEFK